MGGNRLTILSRGTLVRGDLISEDTLLVEGGVEGNVLGYRILVKPTGWVHGDITCRSLSIEPGGLVDGEVRVRQDVLDEPRAAAGEVAADTAYELPASQPSGPPAPSAPVDGNAGTDPSRQAND